MEVKTKGQMDVTVDLTSEEIWIALDQSGELVDFLVKVSESLRHNVPLFALCLKKAGWEDADVSELARCLSLIDGIEGASVCVEDPLKGIALKTIEKALRGRRKMSGYVLGKIQTGVVSCPACDSVTLEFFRVGRTGKITASCNNTKCDASYSWSKEDE